MKRTCEMQYLYISPLVTNSSDFVFEGLLGKERPCLFSELLCTNLLIVEEINPSVHSAVFESNAPNSSSSVTDFGLTVTISTATCLF